MTISSVNSTTNVYAVDPAQADQTTASPSALSGPDATSQVSGPAQWMSELQDLQKSDPDKFKQVTGEIADKLKQEASNSTGQQARFLNGLADKLSQASQSGDMSSLQPQRGVAGHRGHHHHHVQKYASQQQQGAGMNAQQQPLDISQIIDSTLQDYGIST